MMFTKITEHIYALEHQPEVDRPWIGYIAGEKKAMLIDAGNSAAHVQLIRKSLQETGLKMPDVIALTHSHWDHSYGLAGWLQEQKGDIPETYAGAETNRILEKMQTWSWDMDAFEARISTNEIPLFCREHMLLEYPGLKGIEIQQAAISITEPVKLDLGGLTCICMPVTSPHTDDCVVYYCPEEKVLFVGDAYCEEVHGTDWIDRPQHRRQFIETICAFDFVWCVTGHSGIMTREAFLKDFGGDGW